MYNAYTQEAMESCFHGRQVMGVWKCILFHWFVYNSTRWLYDHAVTLYSRYFTHDTISLTHHIRSSSSSTTRCLLAVCVPPLIALQHHIRKEEATQPTHRNQRNHDDENGTNALHLRLRYDLRRSTTVGHDNILALGKRRLGDSVLHGSADRQTGDGAQHAHQVACGRCYRAVLRLAERLQCDEGCVVVSSGAVSECMRRGLPGW